METAKAIELFEKSASVGILLPPDPSVDALAACEVMARLLDAEEKQVGFFTRPEESEEAPHFERIKAFNPLPREFIISVNARDYPVSRISYEKTEDRIDIILSPRSTDFSADAVSFRAGKTSCDLLLAIAVDDSERIPQPPGTEPDFFTQTPIIVLGSGSNQKPFGEANLIANPAEPLCQTVFSLLNQWQKNLPPPPAECATLLLTGILHATDGFLRGGVPAETLAAAAELMRSGGDFATARALASPRKPISFAKIVGRASVRLKIAEDQTILWSFLTAEDFTKTARSASDAPAVLRSLRRMFPHHDCIVLLWQDPADRLIRAAAEGEEALMRTLASRAGASPENGMLAFSAFWENFQDAEQGIGVLLDESRQEK
ncbi:MAG: hypothetical protein HY472_00655 [Candidatus Sungbacteria bacterium]|nr:hypothetical protein [Candidatus Sungbacteria bacterium]